MSIKSIIAYLQLNWIDVMVWISCVLLGIVLATSFKYNQWQLWVIVALLGVNMLGCYFSAYYKSIDKTITYLGKHYENKVMEEVKSVVRRIMGPEL